MVSEITMEIADILQYLVKMEDSSGPAWQPPSFCGSICHKRWLQMLKTGIWICIGVLVVITFANLTKT
jgi:hypothetical protein